MINFYNNPYDAIYENLGEQSYSLSGEQLHIV